MSPSIKPAQSTIPRVLIFLLTGLAGLGVAAYLLWQDHQLTSHGMRATGTVTRLRHTKGGNKPEISWVVGDKTYRTYAGAFSVASDAKIGDTVELVVSNLDPSEAVINSPGDRFSVSGIIGAFGLIFFLVGISTLKRKADPVHSEYQGKSIRSLLFIQGKYGEFMKARKAKDLDKIKSLLISIGIDEIRIASILAEYDQLFKG